MVSPCGKHYGVLQHLCAEVQHTGVTNTLIINHITDLYEHVCAYKKQLPVKIIDIIETNKSSSLVFNDSGAQSILQNAVATLTLPPSR